MKTAHIRAEEQLEDSYWWFIGRRTILTTLLNRFVPKGGLGIDVGCGSGRNLEVLGPAVDRVVGIDRSPAAAGMTAARGFPAIQSDAGLLPLRDASVDVLTALDVLEHMDDDMKTLAEFGRVLKPGGCLLLAVPAYRFLWSEHDEALQHRRRYMASELHAKLTTSGFDVRKRSYAVFFAFLPILLYRLARGIFPRNPFAPKPSHVLLPGPINALFTKALSLEALLMHVIDLPLGTSIVMVGRRMEEAESQSACHAAGSQASVGSWQ